MKLVHIFDGEQFTPALVVPAPDHLTKYDARPHWYSASALKRDGTPKKYGGHHAAVGPNPRPDRATIFDYAEYNEEREAKADVVRQGIKNIEGQLVSAKADLLALYKEPTHDD